MSPYPSKQSSYTRMTLLLCLAANRKSSYIAQVEARLRSLEDTLRKVAPEELEKAPVVGIPADGGAIPHPIASQQPVSDPCPRGGPTPLPFQEDGLLDGIRSPTAFASPERQHSVHVTASDSGPPDPSPSSTQIQPNEPLAHEVGLLSLANSRDSKYLGPSSGVPFARLIFSAIPQSQGLRTSLADKGGHPLRKNLADAEPFSRNWTPEFDQQYFVDAYFETYHPLYPFLDEDIVARRLGKLFVERSPGPGSGQVPQLGEVDKTLLPAHSVLIFLVMALGAKTLESRLSTDFHSERYLATAMQRIDSIHLHDNIEGLQIMLLLTLSGFCFENGPNAWFLTSNIIASCLDLGLQRRWHLDRAETAADDRGKSDHATERNVRSGIFWSAYSLERTLAVILGRPLTLRDEAIDVEFPGGIESVPLAPKSPKGAPTNLTFSAPKSFSGDSESDSPPINPKRSRLDFCAFTPAWYSFTFDRITAEIKLMLHRVVNSPTCFPWPSDLATWQQDTHKRCDQILSDLRRDLKRRSPRRPGPDSAIRSLELKYHHSLMLLHRPSPAIPHPSFDSLSACYNSAMKTILIYSELHRFSKLTSTWITAHTVFVSGITFLYCLWTSPRIKSEAKLDTVIKTAAACTDLLKFIGNSWSVAADAIGKFERLAHLTTTSWNAPAAAPATQNNEMEEYTSLTTEATAVNIHQQSTRHPFGSGGEDWAGVAASSTAQAPPLEFGTRPPMYQFEGADNNDNYFAFEPESFLTELGDISTWFDLNWVAGADTFNVN